MYLPAILTGALLWTAFFPLDLGPVAFVALVPWLTIVRTAGSRRRRYAAAYVGGLAFFLPALQWIRVAHPMMYLSWLGLSLVLPLFWVAALALLRRIDRGGAVPFALSVPVVWVALEYVRAHFPTGFPFLQHVGLYQMVGFGWYFLGYAQHAFAPLLQVADVGGVYAVSFVVAAVNGAAFDWLLRLAPLGRRLGWAAPRPALPRVAASTAAVALLLAGSLAYGLSRLDHAPFGDGPRVAALQGSVSQKVKNTKGDGLAAAYGNLHREALREGRPDLILWPETCFSGEWYELAPGSRVEDASPEFRKDYEEAADYFRRMRPGAPTLLGLNGIEWENGRAWRYNSALLLSTDGVSLGRYDKMHLVPFGEYVPFKDSLPFLSAFTPYENDYSCRPGERWTRFPLKAGATEYHFGCLICYEDSDPYLARQYAGAAGPVDFLVNVSNDGWFDGTEEHEQHLAICRFRAVEARRSIVRSVNMGISCVLDPDGRVVALPGTTWADSVKVEGVVSAVVPLDGRASPYARLGDWVPAACWLLVAAGVVLPALRRLTPGARSATRG